MLGSDHPSKGSAVPSDEQHGRETQQSHRRHGHVRTREEAADEAAAGEQRQRNASELGAAVTFGKRRKADLGRAEACAETDGEADDGHNAG